MNIFRILSSGKHNFREEFISAFLAYLLSPKMDHGIGGAFLASLLKQVGEKTSSPEIVQLTDHLRSRLWENLFEEPGGQPVVELEVAYAKGNIAGFIDIVVRIGNWFIILENKILVQSKTADQLVYQYEGLQQILQSQGASDDSRILVLYLVPAIGSEEDWSVSPMLYKELDKVTLKPGDKKALITWQPVKGTDDDPISIVSIIRNLLHQESRGVMAPVSVELRQLMLSFVDYVMGGFQGYHYEVATAAKTQKDRRLVSEILTMEGDLYIGVQHGRGGLVGAAWKNPAFLQTEQTVTEDSTRGWQYLPLADFKRLTKWSLDPENESLEGMEWSGKPFGIDGLYRVARWGKSELFVGIRGGAPALEAMTPKEIFQRRFLEIRSERSSSQWIPAQTFCEILERKGMVDHYLTDPPARGWQEIFKVGGEGGSIAVMGKKNEQSTWTFAMVTDERTMKCLTDEFTDDELYSSACADTWEGILEKMDQYPWVRLYPLEPFHDEFKELIWAAVKARGNSEYRINDWARCCGRDVNSSR